MKNDEQEQDWEDNDLPFGGPSEWYPYCCRACECRMWVEDIIIDAFPPDGPGKCPFICCPQCGKDFEWTLQEPQSCQKLIQTIDKALLKAPLTSKQQIPIQLNYFICADGIM